MKKRKRISWVLALALLASSVAGCAGGGGNGGAADGDGEKVDLLWYMPFTSLPDQDEVFGLYSDYVEDKINATVEILPIGFGDYGTKMQVIDASREEYDLAYTSNWLNSYYNNVNKGSYIALDDLLPQYAPYTYNEMVKPEIWDGVKVGGKIYGVINQQVFARQPGVAIPTRNLEAMDVDVESLKTLDGVHDYLKEVHEKTGKYTCTGYTWEVWSSVLGYEEFMGSGVPGAVLRTEEGKPVVVNQYETPEFQEYVRAVRQLVEEGVASPTAEESGDNVKRAEQDKDDPISSRFALAGSVAITSGTVSDLKRDFFIDFEGFPLVDEPTITTYAILTTLTAVSSTSKHPERALELLDLMNQDPYLFNLLSYGIEDKNYRKVSDTQIEQIEGHEFITSNWVFGNVFNAYARADQPANMQELDAAMNRDGKTSKIYGFSPDTEPVKIEMTNCKAVTGEYLNTLQAGVADVDATYDAFIAKLKAAGSDALIENLQQQMDAWWETK